MVNMFQEEQMNEKKSQNISSLDIFVVEKMFSLRMEKLKTLQRSKHWGYSFLLEYPRTNVCKPYALIKSQFIHSYSQFEKLEAKWAVPF